MFFKLFGTTLVTVKWESGGFMEGYVLDRARLDIYSLSSS